VSASFRYELHKGKHEDVKVGERKAIFITGAASGIGRAVAIKFAAEGWLIGLADINEQGMAETAAMLPKDASASYLLDVRDGAQWKKALAAFDKTAGGRLDVLFNNAGIGTGGPFEAVPEADHDRMLDVNLKGVIRGAEAAFEYLAKTPGSCLLNTASAAGIYGAAGLAVYAATKFGVRGLTESLDGEWAKYGIKVRSLMPSFIETPILDSIGHQSNRDLRDVIKEAGMEISPVTLVSDAAWTAVQGERLHTTVGPSAKRVAFMARWFPGLVRKNARAGGRWGE
jgi:NAD(P)-dependent dehydrogenase (short-subunit alcohol dehydrogenase family)